MLSKSRSQVTRICYNKQMRVELWNFSQHIWTWHPGRDIQWKLQDFRTISGISCFVIHVNLAIIVNLITRVTTSPCIQFKPVNDSLQSVNDRRSDWEIQFIRLVFGKVTSLNIIGRDDIAADENSQPKNAFVFCVEMRFGSRRSKVSQTSFATSLTIHSFR